MSSARKLTNAMRAAVKDAAPLELKLADLYRTELRRLAREMSTRFIGIASPLSAAATWTPPTVEQVTAVSVRRERILRAQRAMLKAVGAVIGDIEGVSFTLTHPIVQGILDKLGYRVETAIDHASREPVANAIATSWADGLSVPDTAKAIQSAVYGVADSKAVMLARTDLISMSNGSGQWAVAQLNDASREAGEGVAVATKTWLSSQDDRVRETHVEADGQEVPVDDLFQVGQASLMYPGDPDGPDEEVINCRCVVLYNEELATTGEAPGGDAELASGLLAHDLAAHRGLSLVEAHERIVRASTVRFHHTEEETVTQLAENIKGQRGIVTDSRLTDRPLTAAADEEARQRWGSDIAFEGLSTGDGRYMVDGSLSWRTPPLTLMAMIETPEFGGHAGAQVTGRMDDFSKSKTDMDGKKLAAGVTAVYSEGIFDTGDYAQDIERMVGDETLRGVSVDLAILEWGFRDPETGELFNPDEMTPDEWDRAFMGELEFAVIEGEIMAATVCPTPAFADARIALLASAVTRYHPQVWKAGAEYAQSNGVKEGQLMTTLTASIRPLDNEGLTAGGNPIGIAPIAPPRDWFFRPEPDEPTPVTITDDGEFFGHIALWETCHTGYINGEWSQCITPPRSKTGYARFHVGEMVTDEGEHVPIGNFTVGCGHAPMTSSPNEVTRHYDNAGSVGAFVRALDGDLGVWVCGATRSDMTPEQLRDIRACPPSGDWRSVDHNLELHAALAVPVPGFPVQRSQVALAASADGGVEIVALILTAGAEREEKPEPAQVTIPADVLAAMIDGGGEALDDLIAAA